MSGLRPIGSEKLQGDDKIKRILEIAHYKEVTPNPVNETVKTDYVTKLADGNVYVIDKEKMGYIIKKQISEGVNEYTSPMKNRKYFNSYADAMKSLNLMAKDINQLAGVEEGISLFTEQKKYFLKTPKPAAPPVEDTPPVEDAAPSTDMPEPPMDVTPEIDAPLEPDTDMPADDMGMDDMGGEDMGMDDMGGEDTPENPEENDENITFKTIQKLTGKLGQKIRAMEDAGQEISSKDAKYVINSILSALEDNLDEDDKLDIVSKLEGEEEGGGEDMDMGDEMGSEDMGMDDEIPSEDETSMEEPTEGEMTEKFLSSAMSRVFNESKVDKVLSKYFTITENEKKFIENKKKVKKTIVENKKKNDLKEIIRLSESLKQKKVAEKVINSFPEVTFVGKTNKGNLVFESKSKQLKVSPNGQIL
jgi:hypothetical protein